MKSYFRYNALANRPQCTPGDDSLYVAFQGSRTGIADGAGEMVWKFLHQNDPRGTVQVPGKRYDVQRGEYVAASVGVNGKIGSGNRAQVYLFRSLTTAIGSA